MELSKSHIAIAKYLVLCVLVLLVLLGTTVIVARIVLPRFADDLRLQVEQQLSAVLSVPVSVRSLTADVEGLGLILVARDFRVLKSSGDGVALQLDRAEVGLDLLASLVSRRLTFGHFGIRAQELRLVRLVDGSFELQGLHRDRSINPIELLTALHFLELRAARVIVVDEASGVEPLHFEDVKVLVRQDGQLFRLALQSSLPRELGEDLRVAAEIQGLEQDPSEWEIDFYSNTHGLAIDYWFRRAGYQSPPSMVSGELWGTWRDGQLSDLVGDLDYESEALAGSPDAPVVHSVASRFQWRRVSDGWFIGSDMVRFADRGEDRQYPGFGVAVQTASGKVRAVQAAVPVIPLAELTALSQRVPSLGEEPRKWLESWVPSGHVENLRLAWAAGASPEDHRFEVEGELQGVSLAASGPYPGFSNLSARFIGSHRGGELTIDNREALVDMPRLFRWPIAVDSLKGTVRAQRHQQGWRVASSGIEIANSDLQLDCRLAMDLFRDGRAPFLDLEASFVEGNLSQTSTYLPTGIMQPGLVDWLDRAIVSGRVTGGKLLIHGPLDRFPFDQSPGIFEVLVGVEDGILDFHPDWPRAEEIDAEFTFSGRSLLAVASTAQIFEAHADRVTADIPNLSDAQLRVEVDARSSGADLMRFVQASPLAVRMGAFSQLKLDGDHRVDVQVRMPFDDGPPEVDGTITMDGTMLSSDALNLEFEHIVGQVGFTGNSVEVDGLLARLGGRGIEVSGRTVESANRPMMIFEATGRYTLDELSAALSIALPTELPLESRERSQWHATLGLSTDRSDPKLILTSDLQGIAVNLPAPLGKAPADLRPFAVSLVLSEGQSVQVEVDYQPQVQALLEFGGLPKNPSLRRAELFFGEGKPELPEGVAMRVRGSLDHLDLNAWMSELQSMTSDRDAAGPEAASDPTPMTDLLLRQLQVGEHSLQGVHVRSTASGWHITLEDPMITGKVILQRDWRQDPAILNLEWLHLTDLGAAAADPGDEDQGALPSLSSLPPLIVNVKDLRISEQGLGELSLQTRQTEEGLILESFELADEHYKVVASGSSTSVDGVHSTQLSAAFDSSDIGAALRELGYDAAIFDASAGATMEAAWPTPLSKITFESLNGELRFKLGSGRFATVEPGVGRIFGLLNIRSIARRLSLDFRDIFEEGFRFDSIQGSFKIFGGNAYTRDLKIDGPAARISVDGRTGLVAHDYDQDVFVKPNITTPIAMGGALLNPALGAALYLAGNVLEGNLDRVTQMHYKVQGPWDAPEVERVKVQVGDFNDPDSPSDQGGDQ